MTRVNDLEHKIKDFRLLRASLALVERRDGGVDVIGSVQVGVRTAGGAVLADRLRLRGVSKETRLELARALARVEEELAGQFFHVDLPRDLLEEV